MESLLIGALAFFLLGSRRGAPAAESPAVSTGGYGGAIAAPEQNPTGTPGMDAPSVGGGCSPGYIPNPVCLATNRIELDPANPSCGKCVPLFSPVPVGGGFWNTGGTWGGGGEGTPIRRLF